MLSILSIDLAIFDPVSTVKLGPGPLLPWQCIQALSKRAFPLPEVGPTLVGGVEGGIREMEPSELPTGRPAKQAEIYS